MKPKLGTILFCVLICFGTQLVKCNNDNRYTPKPVDQSVEYKRALYCDFKHKNCSWMATGVWKWDNGRIDHIQIDGPPVQPEFSHFNPLVANFTPDEHGSKTYQKEFLISPELEAPKTEDAFCLHFNYYTLLSEASNDGVTLFLMDPDEKNSTAIWSRGNTGIDYWLKASVDVVTKTNFKLKFEAYGKRGYVAVEDFVMNEGLCRTGQCDFEGGMCRDWSTDAQPANNVFKVTPAYQTTFNNHIDHTSHSSFGHFAYLTGPMAGTGKSVSRLVSPEMSQLSKQCFKFSFMRSSTDVELQLLLKFKDNTSYVSMWKSNYTHRIDEWATVQQQLNIQSTVQIVIEADFKDNATPSTKVAVDDIGLKAYECDELVTCSFSKDFCGWETNRSVGLEWSIGTGRVENSSKLKTQDTLSSYSALLYTDFTVLESGDSDSMEIISQPIPAALAPAPGKCLTMDVKVIDLGDKDEFTLAQIDYDGGRKVLWNYRDTKKETPVQPFRAIHIFIPNVSTYGSYRLALRVSSSNAFTRIAINRVFLNGGIGLCSSLPGVSTVPTLPSTQPAPTTPNPYSSLACTFEEKDCVWKSSSPPSNFNVSSIDDITDIPSRYLPRGDFTLKSSRGHFAYAFNLKSSGNLDKATLTAPWPTSVSSSNYYICVDFAYYYYVSGGGSGGSLTVDNSTSSKIIWRAPPGISNQWHRVRFSYSRAANLYQSLTFRTSLVQGVLALDNINITSGYCSYDKNLKQDRVCDFENGQICLFEPVYHPGSKNWQVYNSSFLGMPDHSTHSLDGHFYGLSLSDIPSDVKKVNGRIEVLSNTFSTGPMNEQCIRFSYMIAGLEKNSTSFGYEIEKNVDNGFEDGGDDLSSNDDDDNLPDGTILKSWEITGNTNKLWFTHRVPITWKSDYRIRFFIKVLNDLDETTRKAMFFIDDFTLSFDSCRAAGCDFSNGDICSLEDIPIGDKHLEKSLVPTLVQESNGSIATDKYMNNYVEQLWQVYSPQQDGSIKSLYPSTTSSGYRFGNFLLMTADDDWQRAIVATERFPINRTIGQLPHLCLTFKINKPKEANAYFQIFRGDPFGGQNELIFSMARESHAKFSYQSGWEKLQVLVQVPETKILDVFFYFVGTIGNGKKESYIALDEYSVLPNCDGPSDNQLPTGMPVTDSSGNTLPPPTDVPSTSFKCNNGTVISMDKVCDNHKDCSSNEDERNCGSCQFSDDDYCGYITTAGTKDFKWDFSDKFPKEPYEFVNYLEARNNHRVDLENSVNSLVAEIQSPLIHQSFSYCRVSFSYRMNGSSVSLNPFKFYIINADSKVRTTLYESNFDSITSMEWHSVSVSIGRLRNSFNFGFHAEIGSETFESHSLRYLSKINCGPPDPESGTDDECQDDGSWMCGNRVCIDDYQRCDFTDDCGDNSDEIGCDTSKMLDFSSGFGDWVAKPFGSYEVNGYRIRSTQDFFNIRAGPPYDHTNGPNGVAGKVLFFRQTATPTNKTKPITTELESPYFRYELNCKVSFYFYKNSRNGTINVILEEMDQPDNRIVVNSYSDYSPSWVKATPNYYRAMAGKTYKLIISSSLEVASFTLQSAFPYIAIDDISFTKQCKLLPHSLIPTLATLPGGVTQTYAPDDCSTVRCDNAQGKSICLTSDQMCDFVKDCSNGADEAQCGDCNFDDGSLCGYSSNSLREYWKVRMPANTASGSAPKSDANSNPIGGYVAIYSAQNIRSDSPSPAIMSSPPLNAKTHEDCMVRFSYYSNDGASLNITRKASFPTTPFLQLTEATHGVWRSASTSIGSQYRGFQLQFVGTSPTRNLFYLDIYVDNIRFVNCNPNKAPIGPDGSTISPTSTADVDSVSCDFETDSCGWINVRDKRSEEDSNWIRLSSSSVEPGNDHTSLIEPKPTRSGYWLSVGKAQGHRNDYLRTEFPLAQNQAYCFTFWYYLMNQNSNTEIYLYQTNMTDISYYIASDPNFLLLWDVIHPRDRNWIQGMVEIAPNATRQYLLFYSESYSDAAVGLDDFKLIKGSCADQDIGENCNFESGTCGWKIHNKDWTQTHGRVKDHTTNTYQGATLKETTSTGNEARLDLSLQNLSYFNDTGISSRYMCVRFFYYMHIWDDSKPDDNMYVGVRNTGGSGSYSSSINITSSQVLDEGQYDDWGMLSMNVFLQKTSTLEIFAQLQDDKSEIYIDDISLGPSCEVGGSCSFETDFCGWTNAYSSGQRFVRFQPNTKWQNGNFSRVDATKKTKDGHYALFPTNGRTYTSQELRSPMIRSKSNAICFNFKYFAKTQNMTTALKIDFVDLTKRNGKSAKSILVNGTDSLEWKLFRQQFTDVPKYYRLVISPSSYSEFFSDIGIDDISVSNGKCDYTPTTPIPIPPSETKLNCDFESKDCNWNTSPGWTISSYSGQSDNYAPKNDHTTGTSSGQYALVHVQADTAKYWLQSSVNVSMDKDRCFTFWYYEDGETEFSLTVYQTTASSNTYLTRYTSLLENRRKWTLVKTDVELPTYTFDKNSSYGIRIQYVQTTDTDATKKAFSEFAIDDIKLTPGLCSHQTDFVYNFENGYEDLEVDNIRPLNSYAVLTFKPAYSSSTGYPKVDHTTNTDQGSYFLFRPDNYYTKGSFFENSLSILNLKSDISGDKCVRFAYQITKNITLRAFALSEYEYNYDYAHQNSSMLWASKFPTQPDTWTIVEFNKHQYSQHKIVLYMSSIPSRTDFLAIDDLVVMNQKCQPPIDCDFEQSRFCSYSPVPVSDQSKFNFGIFTAPADDTNWPGPKYDHSKGSYGGAYLYLTSYRTSNTSSAHTAKIISGPREVVRGNSYCLSLYTQLNTVDLSLKFSLLRSGSDYSSANQIVSIGSLTNLRQTSWTPLYIQLNDSNIGTASQIQLIIEGSLGAQSSGAIAVDDIVVLSGQCPSGDNGGGMTCDKEDKVLNQSQICNFVNDCSDGIDEASCGTCDFEKSTCGWKNVSTSAAGFSWVQANSVRSGQAPSQDADSNASGHYLLVLPKNSIVNEVGEVAVNYDQPPLYLKLAYRTCVMVFDYYIKSSGKPKLEIKIGNNRADLSVVYRLQNVQTRGVWRKGYAHIANRYAPFFVDITGKPDNYGAIGIDNVKFVNCSLPTPTASCDSSSEYQCTKNQFCISKDSVCDFVNDCGDNSDELGCYSLPSKCNFETPIYSCKLTAMPNDYTSTRWQVTSPRSPYSSDDDSRAFEPPIDNTLRTAYGHFYMLVPSPTKTNYTGSFSTAMVTSKSDNSCKLRFFYFIADAPDTVTSTKLTVQIRYATSTQPEPNIIQTITIDAFGEVQQRWNKAVIPLGYSSPFQVILTGTLGTKAARIAIDDITFNQGCQTSTTTPAPITIHPPTNSPNPASGVTDSPIEPTTTKQPKVNDRSNRSGGNNGGAITAGILVPLFVVLAAVGGFIWFKRRQTQAPQTDDTFAFSVNNVTEDDM